MIDTVEISPPIFAKALAEHLESKVNDFVSVDKYGDNLPSIDDEYLAKLIQNFIG